MFQEQIDSAIAQFTRMSIGEQPSIIFKEIENSALPASLRKFFSIEADTWVAEERTRLLGAQHFSYSDPELQAHLEGLVRSAKGSARFQREEFSAILRSSVTLLFNYVCRPQYTLSSYLFADAENLRMSDLLERMGHFTDYDYFAAVLTEYAALKQLDDMHRARFEELLAMIDHEVVRHLDSRSLAHLAAPIFGMFQPEEDADFARVPLDALAIFFDDKDLATIVERLEREKQIASSVTMHELVMLVGDVDFSTGLDIRGIVSRQFGMPEPQARSAAPYSAPVYGSSAYGADAHEAEARAAEAFSSPLAIEERETDLDALDVSLDELPPASPVSGIASAGAYEEPLAEAYEEPVGGEHVTPAFGPEDALDQPVASLDQPIAEPPRRDLDNLTIPHMYIDAGQQAAADLPPSLEVTMDQGSAATDAISDGTLDTVLQDNAQAGFEETETAQEQNFQAQSYPAETAQEETAQEEEAQQEVAQTDASFQGFTAAAMEPVEQGAEEMDAVPQELEDVVLPPDELLRPLEEPARAPVVLPDLRTLIPEKDKKHFIKKLFNRDEAAFERAIEALNARTTWQEASPYIDELFREHHIDQYSRLAVEFSDLLYSRCNSKK